MRILFCSTAGAGHVGPLLPVARHLADSGHDVRFLLPPAARDSAEDAGFRVTLAPAPEPVETEALWAAVRRDAAKASVLINRDYFGRLCTAATLPAALELCETWQPALVLHEAAEFASAIAAHRLGIPHAQVAIGLANVEWGALHRLAGEALEEFEPNIVDVIAASPYLTRLPESLDPSRYATTLRYLSPDASRPIPSAESDEDLEAFAPEGTTLVYATLGSMTGTSQWSPGAYRVLLDGFARMQRSNPQIRALLTVGRHVHPAMLGTIPRNTRVEQWIPQDAAFTKAAAVLSHAGSGTAYGALAAGLPQVFFPLFADQPTNAKLLAGAGAGIQVDTQDVRAHGIPLASEPADRAMLTALADEVAVAVAKVLRDPGFGATARRLGAELNALPSLGELFRSLTGRNGQGWLISE